MTHYLVQALIQNFQAHSKTSLEFAKGLNVIFGESDQGKSSILRAIRWVVTNKPLGDSFRKHGTKGTSVSLKKGDNIIRRRKSSGVNEYKINSEKPHKAPKASVPDAVSEMLNMTDVNIQAQHETYFLVHNTPGQRSKILNEVAGLEIMDKTLAATNTEIREVSTEIKFKKQALEDTEKGIKKLLWVVPADSFLSKLEAFEKTILELTQKRNRLEKILKEIKMYEDEQDKFLPAPFVKELYMIIAIKDSIKVLHTRRRRLHEITSKLIELSKQKKRIHVIDVNSIKKLHISLVSVKNKRKRIQVIVSDILMQEDEHMSVFEKELEANRNVTNKLKELGTCPLCKNKISAT